MVGNNLLDSYVSIRIYLLAFSLSTVAPTVRLTWATQQAKDIFDLIK